MRIDRLSKILVLTGLCIFLSGGLFSAMAQDVIRASGGTDISVDTFFDEIFTSISGPTIRETSVGQLQAGETIVLTLPAGYIWNDALTDEDITITVEPVGAQNTDLEVVFTGITGSEATFTVTDQSRTAGAGQGPGRLTIGGLELRPNNDSVPNEGQISNSGTTGPTTANYGNLSTEEGGISIVRVETAADGSGQVVQDQDLRAADDLTVYSVARDQAENFVENIALDDEDDWSLTNTTGSITTGALDVAANRQSATFNSQQTGTTQIRAFFEGVDIVTSGTITVTPRTASEMSISTQPSSTATAGEEFPTQPELQLFDQFGNLVTTDNETKVSASISEGDGNLNGTPTQTADNGVISFTNLSSEIANDIVLEFDSDELDSVTSNTITIEPNAPEDLVYLQQPRNTVRNQIIDPPVEIQLLDAFGNVSPVADTTVTISPLDDEDEEPNNFFQGPDNFRTSNTDGNGIAEFNDLDIRNVDAGDYRLVADFDGISEPVISRVFSVIEGADFSGFEITDLDGNPITDKETGETFNILIRAVDGDGNTFTGFDSFDGDIDLSADLNIEPSIQTSFTVADFEEGELETTFSITSVGSTKILAEFEGTDDKDNEISRDGESDEFIVSPSEVDFDKTVVSASPDQITADGESTTEITVQLRDEFENNLDAGGESITLETDAGTLSAPENQEGSSVDATDQGDGTYTATLTSSTNIETATVEAFEDSDMESPIGSVGVEFTAGGLDNFIITIPLDNGDPATQTAGVEFPITVEGVDQNGNRVESYSGELTFSSNSVISEGGTADISNGFLENHPITLTQSGTAVTISVEDLEIFSVDGVSPEFVIEPAAPDAARSNLFSNPDVIQNDGVSTSTITVVLRDEFENRIIENKINDISLEAEEIDDEGNVIGTPEATLGGLSFNSETLSYTATLTASTTVERVRISGSFNDTAINQEATVDIVVPNTWEPSGAPQQRTDWTRGENWSLGTEPVENDFVIIPGGLSDYPDLDLNPSIGSLEIQDGGQLVLFGGNTFRISGNVQVDGTFDIEDNTTLEIGGSFTGSGTFASGAGAIIEIGGDISINTILAGTDGTVLRLNSEAQQVLNTENFLTRRLEILNDVLAASGDVINTSELFISEGNTFELAQDAGITLDNLQNISGQGSLILNNNTLVVRGDIGLLNIDTSEGTVVFGIRPGEDPADFPDLARQQIENLSQMKSAVINNSEGVRTFDDIIITDGGILELLDGELIISSGRNFIADDITYNGGVLTFRRTLSQPGWRLLSSPITNTFQDWFNGLTLQGMENTNFSDRQPNLLFYDETFEGTDNQRWRTPANATDELTPGRGYFFFVFGDVEGDDDYSDSLPQTLTVTGEEHTPEASESHLDLNVTYTAEADTGFNLVGNPYGATINWDHESWVKENMDDVIYVWDESTNQYRTWNGVSGSLGSGNIAPFQGFWVKANDGDEENGNEENGNGEEENEGEANEPSLKVSPDAKTTGGTFLKSQRSSAEHEWPVIEMQVEGAGMRHSTHFTFTEGGRNNIDRRDAYRLLPFDTNTYLEIFTLLDDGTELAINNLPRKFGKPIKLPLHVSGVNNGAIIDNTITLTWPELTNIPDEWKIILHDSHSSESVNLRDHSFYDFELNARAKTPPEMNTSTNFRLVQKSMAKKQSARFTIEIDPGADADGVPDDVVLHQNYPNPFNQTTTIQFGVPIEQRVKIEVFDVLGRRVQTITDQRYQPGYHEVPFNGRSLASGVYFYRLVTNEKILDKQMTLIK